MDKKTRKKFNKYMKEFDEEVEKLKTREYQIFHDRIQKGFDKIKKEFYKKLGIKEIEKSRMEDNKHGKNTRNKQI